MRTQSWLVLAGLVGIGLYLYQKHRETLRLNMMVFLIVQRGILAPHCGWWRVSDALLEDKSGVQFYRELKAKYGAFVPLNMAGQRMYLVTALPYIRQILDGSPEPFGVGRFKKNMFKPFMSKNVGVSEGCPWRQRRRLNEQVLASQQARHPLLPHFDSHIESALQQQGLPHDNAGFTRLAKTITARIVFGVPNVPDDVFRMFSEANSAWGLRRGDRQIDARVRHTYDSVLRHFLRQPVPGSLVAECVKASRNEEELFHQIPHFIFPIAGLVHTNVPRALLLLLNHPHVMQALCADLRRVQHPTESRVMRHVLLETLRLNNPVVTLFRELRRPYRFDAKHAFPTGTAFVVLTNPVLRDATWFPQPEQFHPGRWSGVSTEGAQPGTFGAGALEQQYAALMFSQGPQRCPGKALALALMSKLLASYLRDAGVLEGTHRLHTNVTLNTQTLPQMLNVCDVQFDSKRTITN